MSVLEHQNFRIEKGFLKRTGEAEKVKCWGEISKSGTARVSEGGGRSEPRRMGRGSTSAERARDEPATEDEGWRPRNGASPTPSRLF